MGTSSEESELKSEINFGMDEKQFTDDELSLIFDPKNYLDETINRKSHIRFLVFWISLLGFVDELSFERNLSTPCY